MQPAGEQEEQERAKKRAKSFRGHGQTIIVLCTRRKVCAGLSLVHGRVLWPPRRSGPPPRRAASSPARQTAHFLSGRGVTRHASGTQRARNEAFLCKKDRCKGPTSGFKRGSRAREHWSGLLCTAPPTGAKHRQKGLSPGTESTQL